MSTEPLVDLSNDAPQTTPQNEAPQQEEVAEQEEHAAVARLRELYGIAQRKQLQLVELQGMKLELVEQLTNEELRVVQAVGMTFSQAQSLPIEVVLRELLALARIRRIDGATLPTIFGVPVPKGRRITMPALAFGRCLARLYELAGTLSETFVSELFEAVEAAGTTNPQQAEATST